MVKVSVKTEAEIAKMREAGRCAAFVLDAVKKQVVPGVSTWDLDQFAKKTMDSVGAVSASYGYGGKKNPFPGYICVSLNEEVVHGIGRKDRPPVPRNPGKKVPSGGCRGPGNPA